MLRRIGLSRHLSTSNIHSEYHLHRQLFLSLGLEYENPGVFNGAVGGDGPLAYSFNPATNKIIGTVRTGTPKDVDETLRILKEIQPGWRSVRSFLKTCFILISF